MNILCMFGFHKWLGWSEIQTFVNDGTGYQTRSCKRCGLRRIKRLN